MLRLRARSLTLATLLVLGGLASPASAEGPRVRAGSFELDAGLGGYFFLHSEPGLDHTFDYNLGLTANFSSLLGLQLAMGAAPSEVNPTSFYQLHLDLIVHPLEHDWFVPFVGVGPTFSFAVPNDGSGDTDPGLNVLAGFDVYPFERVGFRAQARYMTRFGAGAQSITAHDLLASVGLVVQLGGSAGEGEILLDTDGDGILDSADACPTVPGAATAGGCPDRDGDSIADSTDECPDEAGPKALGGCPDRDGDGTADRADRCPDVKGPVALKGCPDTDGDKLVDADDRCPRIAGEAKYQGCPPPPPAEVIKKFSGTIAGITFEYNSDVIRPESYKVLYEAVDVLKQYKQLRILIEGHTSSEGDRSANLDLSQRRADSVKSWLVSKGVAATRIETQGFGPDRPVASNDTEDGRKKNRRIEFRILRK